jgi:hypothetical protein
MASKLTKLAQKIAIQLHLVAESYTIYSSRSRWPVRKLLDTTSYSVISLLFLGFERNIINLPNVMSLLLNSYSGNISGPIPPVS